MLLLEISDFSMKIAVIGAGIAGITFARQLAEKANVTVFEKSRGYGGRMSVRRNGRWQFDHGTQFFTARSLQFRQLIEELARQDIVVQWHPKITTIQPGKKPFRREWFEPHYVAKPSMNALVKFMATQLDVRLQTPVIEIAQQGSGWLLKDVNGKGLGNFDFVVCAQPAPQCYELLKDHFAEATRLLKPNYSPCFALMLGFSKPLHLNFDAAVVRESPLGWLGLSTSRPGRIDSNAIVAHSSNEWAKESFEQSLEWVQKELLNATQEVLGEHAAKLVHVGLHRWRYARVEQASEIEFLIDQEKGLAACGDWCLGNRVEDAFLSGLALGKQLEG
tara:strand:+ start:2439 stop:3437 length:999 start_codon:yes stop_codon:yes gene_type:complete